MKVERLTPILNVSNIEESFAWFEKLGWKKGWDWGDPPDFGGVRSGVCEIFLCQNGQGSRGGPMPRHVGDDDTGGGWMSWWVASPAEVDATYQLALQQGVTVIEPPRDK
ncbi:MAG: bleomycin resistance family protein, partial [Acidobacteriota bacterium]|nr:bleomycin resistance family protein [Acidobacteriota bacterium]